MSQVHTYTQADSLLSRRTCARSSSIKNATTAECLNACEEWVTTRRAVTKGNALVQKEGGKGGLCTQSHRIHLLYRGGGSADSRQSQQAVKNQSASVAAVCGGSCFRWLFPQKFIMVLEG